MASTCGGDISLIESPHPSLTSTHSQPSYRPVCISSQASEKLYYTAQLTLRLPSRQPVRSWVLIFPCCCRWLLILGWNNCKAVTVLMKPSSFVMSCPLRRASQILTSVPPPLMSRAPSIIAESQLTIFSFGESSFLICNSEATALLTQHPPQIVLATHAKNFRLEYMNAGWVISLYWYIVDCVLQKGVNKVMQHQFLHLWHEECCSHCPQGLCLPAGW